MNPEHLDNTEEAAEIKDGLDAQDIFAEHFQQLMNSFGESCEQFKVDTAVTIAKHPNEDQPIVFIRGDLLSATALLASVVARMKAQIYNMIDTEPRRPN